MGIFPIILMMAALSFFHTPDGAITGMVLMKVLAAGLLAAIIQAWAESP